MFGKRQNSSNTGGPVIIHLLGPTTGAPSGDPLQRLPTLPPSPLPHPLFSLPPPPFLLVSSTSLCHLFSLHLFRSRLFSSFLFSSFFSSSPADSLTLSFLPSSLSLHHTVSSFLFLSAFFSPYSFLSPPILHHLSFSFLSPSHPSPSFSIFLLVILPFLSFCPIPLLHLLSSPPLLHHSILSIPLTSFFFSRSLSLSVPLLLFTPFPSHTLSPPPSPPPQPSSSSS